MKEESPQYLRRLNAALALREVPDYPAAMAQLVEAEKAAPTDAQVHLLLGLTHQDLGNLEAAKQSFRLALSIDPDWEPVREALAAFLYQRYRYDEVLELLKAPIESGHGNAEFWYLYTAASLAQLRGQWEGKDKHEPEVEATFAAIDARAESNGEGRDVQARRAGVYQALTEHYLHGQVQNPEKALRTVETGLEVSPQHPRLRRLHVDVLLRNARFAEALEVIAQLKQEGIRGLESAEYVALLGIGDTQGARRIAYSSGESGHMADAAQLLSELGLAEAAATAVIHHFEFAKVATRGVVSLLYILVEGDTEGKAEEALRYITHRTFSPATAEAEIAGLSYPWIDSVVEAWPDWFQEEDLASLLHGVRAYRLLWKGAYPEAASEYATIVARLSDGTYPLTGEEIRVVTCYNGQIVKLFPYWAAAPHFELQAMRVNLAAAYCLAGELDKARAEAQAVAEEEEGELASPAYLAYAVLGCIHHAAGNAEGARMAWQKALDLLDGEVIRDERKLIRLVEQWLAELEGPENEFSG
jgi:Tfp pilus assembly protein PilF